jgi:hypothetical protein
VTEEKKSQQPNGDSSEMRSEHSVLQCLKCSLFTLVQERKDWYVCRNPSCGAFGSSPESLVKLVFPEKISDNKNSVLQENIMGQTLSPESNTTDAGVPIKPKPSEPMHKFIPSSDEQRLILVLFNTSQCSWCNKFYTQPFLCVYGTLHSNCFFFERLSDNDRNTKVEDARWWWRAIEMVRQVEEHGVLARCRKCGALNPNPEQYACWCGCGENSLTCPNCLGRIILKYDISGDFWKCPKASDSRKYKFWGKPSH